MRPEERRQHSASGKEAKNEGGAGAGAGAAAAAETVRGLEGNLPWVHPHRDINFELWTQKFVGASGNLDAVLLDAFLPNETFASQVELYPNKLLNLQQRTLRMGSVTYVPYTVTNYVVSNCRLSLYLSLLFRPTPNHLLLSPLLLCCLCFCCGYCCCWFYCSSCSRYCCCCRHAQSTHKCRRFARRH